jgi:hypothetical protein
MKNTFHSLLRTVAFRFFDLGLIPITLVPRQYKERLAERSAYLSNLKRARKAFHNKSLKYDERGFWFVSPLPTADELNSYYSAAYWKERGKEEKVKARDIDHFLFLKKIFQSYHLAT